MRRGAVVRNLTSLLDVYPTLVAMQGGMSRSGFMKRGCGWPLAFVGSYTCAHFIGVHRMCRRATEIDLTATNGLLDGSPLGTPPSYLDG